MAQGRAEPERHPRGGLALGFAVCALAASWNPLAAPFGVIVGVAAAVLGLRALRGLVGSRRRLPAAAAAVGILAAVASLVVILLTAGSVGVELSGEPIVKGRTPEEVEQTLSQAAEGTRAQRERARKELERAAGASAPGGERVPARDGVGPSPGPAGGHPP